MDRRQLLQLGAVAAVAACARPADDAAATFPATPPPTRRVEPAGTINGSFGSMARGGAETAWTLVRPEAEGPLRPVIALHGKGGDHSMAFDLGAEDALRQAVESGVPPFAVVGVDGGDGYFHRRLSGEDAAKMVVDELIPMLTFMGLDTSRLGLLGWSMGGYGALLIGSQLGPGRVAAIAAVSPALWTSASETAPGAFDGAADYAAFDIFDRVDELSAIPLQIDCGESDPFYTATVDFVGRLSRSPAGGFSPGGHDPTYWRRVLPAEIDFLGRQLAL